MYGQELSEAAVQDAKNLTRLIMAARGSAGEGSKSKPLTQKELEEIEDLVDVSGHSGASFGWVREMAKVHGAGVREAYDTSYRSSIGRAIGMGAIAVGRLFRR